MADRPSYSDLIKQLRPFYRIPAGKLTPAKKRFLTNKWKEFKRKGATKFHAMPATRRKQFEAAGYLTTNKGVFIPQRTGEKFELRKDHAKFSIQNDVLDRQEFEFPLTKAQTSRFLLDPGDVIEEIKRGHPRIFNAKRRALEDAGRLRWRLIFSKGARKETLGLDELQLYIQAITDTFEPDDDEDEREQSERGKRVMQSLVQSMTSLRASFVVPK